MKWVRIAGFLLVIGLLGAAAFPYAKPLLSPPTTVGASLSDWTCADQTKGPSVSFCVTLPPSSPQEKVAWNIGQDVTAAKIGLMAQVHGIALQSVPMTWGDLWVEEKVDQATRKLLADTLDGDLARIGQDFGRPFTVRPKVITFATAASFEKGMETLFGYPSPVARALATNNGGALIIPIRSIAINWSTLGNEKPLTILRHELAHAMIREVTGSNAVFPAWFDEGLATMEQSSWDLKEDDRYLAASVVKSGKARLDRLTGSADWIKETATLKGTNYHVAAAALGELQKEVGVTGIARILEDLGKGADFDAAYASVATGKSLATFTKTFPDRLIATTPAKIQATELANGAVEWSLKGLAPGETVVVTIDGEGVSYHLSFDVTADPSGFYRSSFGATAPAGAYVLAAKTTDSTIRATATVRKP